MCTLGLVSRGLIDVAAECDPARVTRIACRFSAPTFPGEPITLTVFDKGGTTDGHQEYAFEAEAGANKILSHGRFEVRPA